MTSETETEICPICNGTGENVFGKNGKCFTCNGTGEVLVEEENKEDWRNEE